MAGRQKWGLVLSSSARVSQVTYQTVVGVKYPELVTFNGTSWKFGKYVPSAYFLDAVGQHFWFRMQLDILELVARYLYALWSSPGVDAEAWNQGFYGFFIPNNQMRACA